MIHQFPDRTDHICRINDRCSIHILRVCIGRLNDLIPFFTKSPLRIASALPCLLILIHHIVNPLIQPIQQIQKLLAVYDYFIRVSIVCFTF